MNNRSTWYWSPEGDVPQSFVRQVSHIAHRQECHYLAQLLWNRGVTNQQQLEFLGDFKEDETTSYQEWGQEINYAIQRIEKARNLEQKIAIWGNWQIDTIMATCVFTEGLQDFWASESSLDYYFPPRDSSTSSSLNRQGINELAQRKITLIIAINHGSRSHPEIEYARSLGIEMIIIDRPILKCQRPPVISWFNPDNFASNHPFYHFSAVSIVYKLMEGLTARYPDYFSQPVTNLLDLVALSLLTEGINLQGEARHLTKQGIKLIEAKKRPQLQNLSETINQIGDRDLDPNYGLSNRIRAISSISSNIFFCLDLLTSNNFLQKSVMEIVDTAEKMYFNCLDLLQVMVNQIRKKIERTNGLSDNLIIVEDHNWSLHITHLAAKIITEEYRKPILLILTPLNDSQKDDIFAYFYSCQEFKWDELLTNVDYLIENYQRDNNGLKFILSSKNIHLFKDIFRQKIRHLQENLDHQITIDLIVKARDINSLLYENLQIIEPYSLDNPIPQLLLKNCQINRVYDGNLKNKSKHKNIRYKKISLFINDQSCQEDLKAIWYSHYPREINNHDRYDILGEINYDIDKNDYYLRIVDLKKIQSHNYHSIAINSTKKIIDYRNQLTKLPDKSSGTIMETCPTQWQEIVDSYEEAETKQEQLILAYNQNEIEEINRHCLTFMGMLKFLIIKQKKVSIDYLSQKIKLAKEHLHPLLTLLISLKIIENNPSDLIKFQNKPLNPREYQLIHQKFRQILQEVNLGKKYFLQTTVDNLEKQIKLNINNPIFPKINSND